MQKIIIISTDQFNFLKIFFFKKKLNNMNKIIENKKIKLNGCEKISKVTNKVKNKKLKKYLGLFKHLKKYNRDKINNKTIKEYGRNSWEYFIKKILSEIKSIKIILKSLFLNSWDNIKQKIKERLLNIATKYLPIFTS